MTFYGDKCYLIYFSTVKSTKISIKINNELIHGCPEENLLGIVVDKTSSFKAYVTSPYKKKNSIVHPVNTIYVYFWLSNEG